MFCASVVVGSSTGKVLCASVVVRSSTGKCFGQVFCGTGRALCKSRSMQDEFCSRGVKMSKEGDVRMKSGVKAKELSRQKVSKETISTERGPKKKSETTGNKENGAKRTHVRE